MSGSARRLLLIAFHFPPIQGSTGVTRTLAFAKYLRDCGWEVTVLTAHPRAYPESRAENLAIIPPHVRVERAAAFDTRRHLSLAGKYPLALAVPDRWQSWIAGGFLRARRVIRQWRPDVIMCTYPIASAHYLGHLVHKWSGLPWGAAFRIRNECCGNVSWRPASCRPSWHTFLPCRRSASAPRDRSR